MVIFNSYCMLVYQRVLPILPQLMSDGSPASPPLEHGASRQRFILGFDSTAPRSLASGLERTNDEDSRSRCSYLCVYISVLFWFLHVICLWSCILDIIYEIWYIYIYIFCIPPHTYIYSSLNLCLDIPGTGWFRPHSFRLPGVIRDIPEVSIVAGNSLTNLRQAIFVPRCQEFCCLWVKQWASCEEVLSFI